LAEHVSRIEVDASLENKNVQFLVNQGRAMWHQLRAEFPSPLVEVALDFSADGIEVTGHADVISVVGDELRILDWKSGMKDSDYSEQMKGYASLGLLKYPSLQRATSTLAWLREREIERYTVTREQSLEWWKRVIGINQAVFSPGSHCAFCPRSHECSKCNAMVRRDVAAMLDVSLDDAPRMLSAMAPDGIIDLLAKSKLVAQYADRVKEAIRYHVAQVGLVEGSSKKLLMVEENRRHLDPLKAWPVLESFGFGDEEFAGCVKISASEVDSIMAKKAGRGNGSKSVAALKEKLTSVDALRTYSIKKLVEKRK
jgi:hypothetical protein